MRLIPLTRILGAPRPLPRPHTHHLSPLRRAHQHPPKQFSTTTLKSTSKPTTNPSHPPPPHPAAPAAAAAAASAPSARSGPLLTRQPNRPLPPLHRTSALLRTLPLFAALMLGAAAAIFNYQKQASPVITSALYALRVSPRVRAALGDEIGFAAPVPWIRGGINLVRGRVDVGFWVKGTSVIITGEGEGERKRERVVRKAWVRFVSVREGGRRGAFTTLEWSIQPEGGAPISLLADDPAADPLARDVEAAREAELGAAA